MIDACLKIDAGPVRDACSVTVAETEPMIVTETEPNIVAIIKNVEATVGISEKNKAIVADVEELLGKRMREKHPSEWLNDYVLNHIVEEKEDEHGD